MLNFLSLNPEAFGLDISDLSIKIAKLKRKRGRFILASFGETPVPQGIIEKGEIKDQDLLSELLKKAVSNVKGQKLKTNFVVASLPEERTFLQVIQMPKMAEEEARRAAAFEAENYIPLSIKDVYIDAQVVRPFYDHLEHVDVLIAAFPKITVDSYLNCIKKSGLRPIAFETEAQAIARSLIKNEVSAHPVLLLDLGATRTSLVIFSGYSLRFTSSISFSGRQLTQSIAQALSLPFDKAEDLKIRHGLIGSKKVAKALSLKIEELASQITNYLDYYQTYASHQHLGKDGKGVEKIYLCGGGANLKGLQDFLSDSLSLPVEIGNPWVNILPFPLKELPDLSFKQSLKYTTALGLALRGVNFMK